MGICLTCGGKGYLEFEAGLLRVRCQACKGTGHDSVSGTGEGNIELIRRRGRPVGSKKRAKVGRNA